MLFVIVAVFHILLDASFFPHLLALYVEKIQLISMAAGNMACGKQRFG